MKDVRCALLGKGYLLGYRVVCCVLSRPENGLERVMAVVLRSKPTRPSQRRGFALFLSNVGT